jgi:hypothetical protein
MSKTILVFILTAMPWMASAANSCWQNEINPYTNRTFADASAYDEVVESWNAQEPELPWITQLYKGWRVAKVASVEAKVFKSDKQMHCYVGCRIAQEAGYVTAEYAGWRKEYQDITDCSSNTRFEFEDQAATVLGAEIGDGTQGKNLCINSCPAN